MAIPILSDEEADERYAEGLYCHADKDGDCTWKDCPQLKDYRHHCLLDFETEEW